MFRTFRVSACSILLIIGCFLSTTSFSYSQNLLPMPKPTHSEEGVPRGKLKLLHTILPDFDEKMFYAKPRAITVDDEGSIYIFDSPQRCILKFNKNYKYVTRFMSEGRGPGEIWELGMTMDNIDFAPDGNIYISDPYNDKLIVYAKSGKHVKDIRLFRLRRGYGYSPFRPAVDSKGNLYAYARERGIIEMLKTDSTVQHRFLDKSLLRKCVIYVPSARKLHKNAPKRLTGHWFRPAVHSVSFCVTNDDLLLIFLASSSTMYVFKEKKLVRKFDILFKSVMERFRDEVEEEYRNNKGVSFFFTMFSIVIPDRDDKNFFYLQGGDGKGNSLLYKFSLTGRLVKILSYNQYAKILIKRNDRFYGFSSKGHHPIILKEEVSK